MNSKVLAKIEPWLPKAELFLSIVFIAGIILRSIYFPGSHLVVILTLCGLLMVYFISVYLPVPQQATHISPVVFSKLLRIACSFTALGILFMYLKFSGYSEILLIGIISITIGCTFFMFIAIRDFGSVRPFRFDLVRGLGLILIAITLLIERNTL